MLLLESPTQFERNRIFGQIARSNKYLSQEQFIRALDEVCAVQEQGRLVDLGKVCAHLGYLTEMERGRIAMARDFFFAQKEDRLIAEIALRDRFISSEQLDLCKRKGEQIYRSGATRVPRLLGLLSESQVQDPSRFLDLLKGIQAVAMCERNIQLSRPPGEQPASHDLRSATRFKVADGQVGVRRPQGRGLHSLLNRFSTKPKVSKRGKTGESLVDLSLNGLQTVSDHELKANQELEVGILLPVFPQPLKVMGRVQWTETDDGGCRMGVMFTELNSQTEQLILQLAGNPFLCSIGRSAFELKFGG